jgi:hypothetical protein
MSAPGTTPGPWRVRVGPRHDPETCDLSICGDIFVLADFNGPQYAHQEPNAHLMAAAPDLYAALKWFIDDIDGTHTVMVDFDANVERARAALELARGTQQ